MTPPRNFPPNSTGDAELDVLFGAEAELLDTARLLRAAAPEPVLDVRFRRQLRGQLMAEAEARVAAPRPRTWWQRRAGSLPALFAGGFGTALVAATLFIVLATPGQKAGTPSWSTPSIANVHNASTAEAITVVFDQPMDQNAVVAGLHIQPATSVTTSWQGNTLVITPVHPLTANTAYTVNIDQTALRTQSGTAAAAPLAFSFGTAPTATPGTTPTPAVTPTLQPSAVSAMGSPSLLGFAPDGAPLASGTIAPAASATGATTASPAPSPTASAAAGTGSTQPASPSPEVTTGAGTYVLRSGQPAQRVADAATAAAFAPDAKHLAVAVAADAGSSVMVSDADGSNAGHLLDTASPVVAIAWTSATQIDVVTATTTQSVTLDGHHQVIARTAGGEHFIGITSTARFVTATAADHIRVIDLSNGAGTTLAGATQLAWSVDGSTAVWLTGRTVNIATAGHLSSPDGHVAVASSLGSITALTLNRNGTEFAIGDAGGSVRIQDSASGGILATGSNATGLVFSPTADRVFFVSTDGNGGAGVYVSDVPAASTQPVSSAPAAAVSAVDTFVAAQVSGDLTKLSTLAPGVDVKATPAGLTRSYVIAVTTDGSGVVSAQARLIADPGAGHAAVAFSDETLTLNAVAGGAYQVTKITVGKLIDEPNGPHVIHVSAVHGSSVITISFDGDLDPATVSGAISVESGGTSVPVTTTYDPMARTATVTLTQTPHHRITVKIVTSLTDISGQPLAQGYSVTLAS